jgi:hypothetical protein
MLCQKNLLDQHFSFRNENRDAERLFRLGQSDGKQSYTFSCKRRENWFKRNVTAAERFRSIPYQCHRYRDTGHNKGWLRAHWPPGPSPEIKTARPSPNSDITSGESLRPLNIRERVAPKFVSPSHRAALLSNSRRPDT